MTRQSRIAAIGGLLLFVLSCEPSRNDHPRPSEQLSDKNDLETQQEQSEITVDNTVDWEKLRDADPHVRREACKEFRSLPPSREFRNSTPDVAAALVEMLKGPIKDVRAEAGTSLVFILEPTKISALIQALGSSNTDCRYEAAYALGRIGSGGFYGDATPAIEPLLTLLADGHVHVRMCAAWALVKLDARDPRVFEVLATGLASEDKGQVWWAFRGFEDRNRDSVEFFDVHRPPSVVGSLLRILSKDSDPDFRMRAAFLLEECHDNSDRVVAGLTAALLDAEWKVRHAAASAFSRLSVPDPPGQVFEILCKEMDTHDNWSARREVCKAFERLNRFPPCVVQTLTKHIGDEDRENRLRIACLLSRCSPDSFAEVERVVVTCIAETPESYLRLQAIKALGRTGFKSPAARQVIEDAKKDEAAEVRDAAEKALQRNR
jgi:HEAT repeat protein